MTPLAADTPVGAPALLVHGGAWDIADAHVDEHVDGLRKAVARGRSLLERGRSALDVVEETVAVLEAHPAFDAGRGAVLDRDGRPQLDAGLMDGSSLAWGAVANVRTLPHPIRLARHLLEYDGQARLVVGEGAERLAAEWGFPQIDPELLIVERERERFDALREAEGFHTSHAFSGERADAPRGTVGCVALDVRGRLAAATSTGGAPRTVPGRVGDSPLVGSGFWADGDVAASATGWGEAIATVQLCRTAARGVEAGATPSAAAARALAEMHERVRWQTATGGLILLDRQGRSGWAFTTPRMARAFWAAGHEPRFAVRR